MRTSIYVVTHKKFIPPNKDIYLPIQVGKSRSNIDLGYLSDDTLENIAEKNSEYCELTALYWIWKNDRDSDIIGLCHYRRYFSLSIFSRNTRYFIDEMQIQNLLSKYDVIVPQLNFWGTKTVEEMYDYGASAQDIEIIRTIIQKYYPQYIESYELVLNSHSAFYRNMIICERTILMDYCNWLFDILFKLEGIVKQNGEDTTRKFGFISEFLLDVWVINNQLKIKYCRVVNTEDKLIDVVKGHAMNFWFKYRCCR